MNIYNSNIAQYEDYDDADIPIKLVTDLDLFQDPTRIQSFFQSIDEPTNIDKDNEKLTGQTVDIGKFTPPIIKFPSISHRRSHMTALQKWQGHVLKITDHSLFVKLVDLTKKGPDEEAEIPLEEITKDDKDLIKLGSIFYWSIGYLDSYIGQRTRVSLIRFQRLPVWSKQEIDEAEREAERLRHIFRWE